MKIFTKKTQMLADTKTPVSLYLSLRDEYRSPLLLESSDYNSKTNHFSFLCFEPIASIELNNSIISTTIDKSQSHQTISKNIDSINNSFNEFINQFEFSDYLPDELKGLFGYCSFNIVEFTHELNLNNQTNEIPTLLYHLYSIMLVFNHSNNELIIYSNFFDENKAEENILTVLEKIQLNRNHDYFFEVVGEETTSISDEEYKSMVTKAKEHCKLGDVFQLVISRKFYQNFKGDDFNVYRILKKINPSPYLFYFDTGSFRLFGSSPEAQLKINSGIAEIHPIAGTYKRTGDDVFDLEKSKELLNDKKENSEHVMLVDLARNDLSKYSNKVEVKSYKQIQFYSHVIHMVSNVISSLKEKHNAFEVLTGTFPAGTLSGAPKHRAIQLINELEGEARHFYGGTIGFIGQKKELNQAIIIRSFFSKNNKLTYQAGAGVVESSDEESELNEVFNKINVLRKSIKEASNLFQIKI